MYEQLCTMRWRSTTGSQHIVDDRVKSSTYDSVLGVVSVKVDTTDEHRRVSRRSGDDDLLCAALQMCLGPMTQSAQRDLAIVDKTYLSTVVKTP